MDIQMLFFLYSQRSLTLLLYCHCAILPDRHSATFRSIAKEGRNIPQKYKKTAILTERDEKTEQRQILWKTVAQETRNTKPLIVATTHDKTLSSGY